MKNVTLKQVVQLFGDVNKMTDAKRTLFVARIEEEAKKLKLGNGDTVDGFIYKTETPEQFGGVDGNRIINEESVYVRDLAESISEIGNVSPIIVNETNQTIDGQRRITAVRKYGLKNPIRYTRVHGATLKTVGELNRLQAPWNYKDWLHKYVAIGHPEYVFYKDLEDRFSKYMRPRSLRSLFMNNRIEGFKSSTWEQGEFKINKDTVDEAIKFLMLLEKIHTIGESDNIFAKNRSFQKALHEIFKSTKDLDENRLLKKVKTNFNRLNVRTEYPEYKKMIAEVYNMRLRSSKDHLIQVEEPIEIEMAS